MVASVGAKAIVGVSAGASAAALVTAESPELTYVNVCGRLHSEGDSIYKFANYKRRSPIFVETVHRAERVLDKITADHALVYRPLFDELVPKSATLIENVRCVTLPVVIHSVGIYTALRWRGNEIADLLT